ncbi:hypothetical protein GCM10010483_40330 [Actinokineospora diospyrosa]
MAANTFHRTVAWFLKTIVDCANPGGLPGCASPNKKRPTGNTPRTERSEPSQDHDTNRTHNHAYHSSSNEEVKVYTTQGVPGAPISREVRGFLLTPVLCRGRRAVGRPARARG